jgi:hypothetical protein
MMTLIMFRTLSPSQQTFRPIKPDWSASNHERTHHRAPLRAALRIRSSSLLRLRRNVPCGISRTSSELSDSSGTPQQAISANNLSRSGYAAWPVESPALGPALTPAPGALPPPGRVVGRVSSRVLSPVSGPVTIRVLVTKSSTDGSTPRLCT